MEHLYTDGFGTYWDGSGNRYDVYDLIMAGINVAGATLSDSPYYAENDPRFKQGQYPPRLPVGGGYPSAPNSPVSFNPQGFQMPWWALLGIGLLAGSFLLGKRR